MDTATVVWIIVGALVLIALVGVVAFMAKRSKARNVERRREQVVEERHEAQDRHAHARQRDAEAAELQARAMRREADADALAAQAARERSEAQKRASDAGYERRIAAEKQAHAHHTGRELGRDDPGPG